MERQNLDSPISVTRVAGQRYSIGSRPARSKIEAVAYEWTLAVFCCQLRGLRLIRNRWKTEERIAKVLQRPLELPEAYIWGTDSVCPWGGAVCEGIYTTQTHWVKVLRAILRANGMIHTPFISV